MNKFSYQLCKSLHSLTRSPVHLSFRYNWGLSEVNRFTLRQHNCGDLKESDVGKKVTLHGWIKHIRTHGSAVFLVVNDAYGETQLIVKQSHVPVSKLPIGSVIKAEGTVTKRPKGQENNKMKTGAIEVLVDQFEVINKRTFPALITKESDRLKFRYIDLRNKAISSNLRLKSQIMNNVRNFFHQEGFIEVETPLLQKHTPGGAHEFIVPTHEHNKFYCLAQSPQIFKQLLMIGGLDRYFQIAKCMRDEVARPDRQPEFSQIDLEMSFTNTDGIIDLIEALLVAIWPSFAGSITIPFPRISYDEALQKYGSDKPDLRSDVELHDLTAPLEDIIKKPAIGLSIPNGVDENLESKLYQLSLSVAEDLAFDGKVIGLKINDPDCWTLDREDNVKLDEPIKFCITQKMKLYKGDYLFVAYGDNAEICKKGLPFKEPIEFPLPDLIGESEVLTEDRRRDLARHLPARTEGYSWALIYSTSKHGFSLKTIYRNMVNYENPVLLVIQDTDGSVFGALTSTSLRTSDHFYGTGETFLFSFYPEFRCFRWTGDNVYFIKGDTESIAFGAGDGSFGLWLDGDLYHGSSNPCQTFGNPRLSKNQDFVVKTLECWGFV